MKIAQVTPLYEAVPPKLYGGTERVVAHLTDALVDLGHDVTLFASADAETRARLIPVRDQAIRLDPAPLKSDLAAHMVMLSEVLKRADDFDVIHFHTDIIQFPMFERYADRTLTTLHGRLDMKDIGGVYERWPNFGLVSISDDQRRPLPFANWKATVQHGMPAETYKFSPKSSGYLAFLGRISPEKRPDRAIQIAIALNKPLKMAAKVDAADKAYWETVIKPMIDGRPCDLLKTSTPTAISSTRPLMICTRSDWMPLSAKPLDSTAMTSPPIGAARLTRGGGSPGWRLSMTTATAPASIRWSMCAFTATARPGTLVLMSARTVCAKVFAAARVSVTTRSGRPSASRSAIASP